MNRQLPQRPISGGTNNGLRPARYTYWRVGYGAPESFPLDFWVERAGEFHSRPNYLTGPFDHPDYNQVFFHLSGEATFEVNGRIAPVHPGNLLLIPAGSACFYRAPNGVKYHWFGLSPRWPAVLGQPTLPRLLAIPYNVELNTLFVEMREVLILRQPGYPLRAVSLFYEMMARVAELTRPAGEPESVYPEAVRNAIIYLRENVAKPFNAADLATAVSISESHLRALFEKWIGESPRQFHTRCRIDQARRLLLEQRLSVSEVALHVGFADARYFSRVFKQFIGVTPSQYAEDHGR